MYVRSYYSKTVLLVQSFIFSEISYPYEDDEEAEESDELEEEVVLASEEEDNEDDEELLAGGAHCSDCIVLCTALCSLFLFLCHSW